MKAYKIATCFIFLCTTTAMTQAHASIDSKFWDSRAPELAYYDKNTCLVGKIETGRAGYGNKIEKYDYLHTATPYNFVPGGKSVFDQQSELFTGHQYDFSLVSKRTALIYKIDSLVGRNVRITGPVYIPITGNQIMPTLLQISASKISLASPSELISGSCDG
ncbi:MAG: hypothetical protein ACYCUX_05555 [Metallibacterium sp.]